jgi:hypothetical protein
MLKANGIEVIEFIRERTPIRSTPAGDAFNDFLGIEAAS